MPIKPDFSVFRRPTDAYSAPMAALSEVGKQLNQYQNVQQQIAQAAEAKRRGDIADERAATQLELLQTRAGDEQAKQARQDLTASEIGKILAAPTGKRASLLGQAQQVGGFTPSSQEQQILLKALEQPKTEYSQPDMYRYDKTTDQVVAFKPRSSEEEKAYAKAGYQYGQFTRGREDGVDGKGGKKGSKDEKIWSLTPAATSLEEEIGTRDAPKLLQVGQKLQDTFGLTSKQTTEIVNQSIDKGWIDDTPEPDKLANALKTSGIAPNVFKEVNGKRVRSTVDELAKGFFNPNIQIRTESDGTRVLIDMSKEMRNPEVLPESKPKNTTILTNPNSLSAL